MPLRVLILGGTTEASALARLLADDPRFAATLSLAGRTAAPSRQPLPTRIGGFGGADGLARFLRDERIELLIDATHPYAAQISANAVAASHAAAVPLASLLRPAWSIQPGDQWQTARTAREAAETLGPIPQRVFLSLGRQELHAFVAAPQHHYLARVIDPPDTAALPPDLRLLQARGPFDRDAEVRLLCDERIDILVSKNAGGAATYAKIEAARELGLPVMMIARPDKPAGDVVADAEHALAWLESHLHAPRSRRGV
ncbi:precorrin-6A/cobalt-precorrin-6A reductase [Enhydrobacter aerosaccus]|uniref:Precorrin-6A/cobalt-precorrin-6A reductase n=2 Tax=Enhydrobacter aerosaccus TaxID=225324 RepID=A0A1T4NXN3_9HYPH|nr:precorrin-6A/cobalt-precorrin-6A reductase [Enhydrobacter aerosaccus]